MNNRDKRSQAELQGDPMRQAMPLFRGIDYQIWQTVLAWIDLAENEILVVEGAEDFDVIGEKAVGNQVKNLAAPISLRSVCVCETIRNFWTTRNKNPSRTIGFRLITTANLSFEAGEPFGASKLGLELWNEDALRKAPKYSHVLRDFLLSDPSVSKRLAKPLGDNVPPLIEYLRRLSPESFHVEFVQRINWLSQQPDVEVIRDIVRVKLRAYGEGKHLLARDSERAFAPLFEYIAHVAIKERRSITRDDFRVQFDDATRVNVPVSRYNRMQAALAVGLPSAPPATSEVNYSLEELISIPDLPVPCALRTAFVDKLATSISEHGFIAIQGSTGKGKSTLAKLLARRLSGNWLWINFANWEAVRISEALQHLSTRVAILPHNSFLLLDDFNPTGTDSPLLAQKLAVLSRITLMRGGQMIVTTQRLLGNVFLRQSNLPPEVLHQVVAFRKEEVEELCLQAGCPTGARLEPWVSIISAQTGQHPQLVHARVKVASRRGWQIPTITDLIETPQEITDERQLARQLLRELDDGEVELLYRLSIASRPFRRDQVMAVGEISPPIVRPGDKFDALVGPWIEPAGNKYFRLSFLLAQAAEGNWTMERVKTMRVEYAMAIQRTKDRTLTEASEILFQAVATQNAALAGPILASITLAPIGSRKNCAQALGWMLALSEPNTIFQDNRFVTHLFSLVQFRLATESDSASAPRFAERLFAEAKGSINPEVDCFVVMGAATDIILAIRILVAPDLLLQCWLNAVRLAGQDERLNEVASSVEWQRSESGHLFPPQSFGEMLFSFILSREGGSDYLRQLLAAVDKLPPDQREQVILAIKANRFRMYGFIDRVWTHELAKETPDWNEVVSALREAIIAGERWGLTELCMVAARDIAAIQDECLLQRDKALKTLAEIASQCGDGLMLRYQRGMIHFLHQEYDDAYREWVSTFDEWPADSEEGALYAFNAFSNCGAAAGFMNRWGDSAKAFERGRNLAMKVGRHLDAQRFGIDAAYAHWRADCRKESIIQLARYLTDIEKLGETTSSTEFHTQWKLTEHIIVWCKSDAGAPHNLEIFTPRPGICSEVKTKEKHDLVKNAPRAPALLSWYCLAEAELYAELGCNIFQSIVRRSDLNDYPNLRPMLEFLRVRRAMADGEFKNIPLLAERGAVAISTIDIGNLDERALIQKAGTAFPKANAAPSVVSFIEESLLCVLLVVSSRGIAWDVVINQWAAVADQMQCPGNLTTAIGTIKRICTATPMEIYSKYIASTSPRFSQVVAGLQLVVHPDSGPALCHVGLCALVTDAGFATNLMFSHEALATLTRKTWLARLSVPSGLCSAHLTVPAINAACESNKKGLALAATILLAAGSAVNVEKVASIQTELQKLAAGTIEKRAPQA